ncbi:uncharacterized protein LOC100568833 isoform X1 [Acyrthosiphon pisum]|uniref:MULE transposase domain-containing protein n=1 Tax=Acyrthosiphon pisum TaxID=7029 RepID=A0A8R2JSG8_ACYPI|nr:uncharacterized protein LOC100568833 isoform X1 [Acyrthosiphon pisum]XP_029345324.1 uncharacterized protein LOC100568833 isoform X1 [Acyrthosiphon pisum]XP_029345325.1 uncharacterized protein LOC100568833 isoform X1 [Acyrthosiphon pisum]|eukprot:XP_016660024.1 PREDICTED: uncharacterized protein LOC100568833 isoform X1 [Acyrthosiphon pisum]
MHKWLCTVKTCYASIVTDAHKTSIVNNIGEHTHESNSEVKIERQILRENCKRQAADGSSTQPIKIIRKELMDSVSYNFEMKDIISVQKTMYDKRRQSYPLFPTSLNAIRQLQNMKDDNCCMLLEENFVHVSTVKSLVCITNKENLQFMMNCSELFADGTFQYALKHFYQLYTIHCYKNGFYAPVVYFFLPNKTKETYQNMWLFLVDLCMKLTLKKLEVTQFRLDFEIGAHEAIRDIFPDAKLMRCRFHLGQAWWRKIQQEQVLRIAYMNESDQLGTWLKSFFALAYLPFTEIEDGFLELMATCPNEKYGHIFSDYVLKTYIEPECPFPPEMWAQEPNTNPRTTGGPESFHKTYDGQFYSAHPPIHVLIQILTETQMQTRSIIQSVNNGRVKKMAKKDLNRIQNTIKDYDEYKIHKNVIHYLKVIGYRCQGFQI